MKFFLTIQKNSRDAIPEDQELEFEALEEEEEGGHEKTDSPADKRKRTCCISDTHLIWFSIWYIEQEMAVAFNIKPLASSISHA